MPRCPGAQVPRWFLDPDFKPDLTWYLHGDTQSTRMSTGSTVLCAVAVLVPLNLISVNVKHWRLGSSLVVLG